MDDWPPLEILSKAPTGRNKIDCEGNFEINAAFSTEPGEKLI